MYLQVVIANNESFEICSITCSQKVHFSLSFMCFLFGPTSTLELKNANFVRCCLYFVLSIFSNAQYGENRIKCKNNHLGREKLKLDFNCMI